MTMENSVTIINQNKVVERHNAALNFGFGGWEKLVQYLREADLDKQTIPRYRCGIKKYIEFVMEEGITHLDQCSVANVIRFKSSLAASVFASNTKNLYLQGVKSFYDWYALNGGVNLARDVSKFTHVGTFTKEGITLEEFNRVLQKISTSRSNLSTYDGRRDYAIISTLYLTGMRQMSLQNLRWQDLVVFGSTEAGDVRLALRYKRKCKGENFGHVVVTKELMTVLKDWSIAVKEKYGTEEPKQDWYIFGFADKMIDNSWLRDIVRARLIDAGVYVKNQKTGHCLRHGIAELLIEKGMTLQGVADMLGHASTTSTMFYTKRKEQKKSMDNASELLNGILEVAPSVAANG